MRRRQAKLFREQEEAVLEALEQYGDLIFEGERQRWLSGRSLQKRQSELYALDLLFSSEDWMERFLEMYRDEVSPEMLRAMEEVFSDLNIPLTSSAQLDAKKQAFFSVKDPNIQAFVETRGFDFVKGVNQTTRDSLRAELIEAFDAGEGVREFAKRVRGVFGEASRDRSLVIARTEMGMASEAGTYTGMKEAKEFVPELQKMWLATPDERTRASHAAADGQVQDVDRPYEVGGFQMLHPLDSSLGAPAKEIIMCRCASTPAIGQSVENQPSKVPQAQPLHSEAKASVAQKLADAGVQLS